MDLVSNDQILEVNDDLQKEEGSDFGGTLDLNLLASKDEEGNGYGRGNSPWNDGSHEMGMDLNQQDRQCSPMLPPDSSFQGGESLKMKPSSNSQSESPDTDYFHYVVRKTKEPHSPVLNLDDVEKRNFGGGLERFPSPSKDNHLSGELETVGSSDYSGKLSSPLQMESFRDDIKTEDTLLSVVANTKNERLMESRDLHGAKSPHDGEMNRYSDHFLGNPEVEKMNSTSACDSENYHCTSKDESLKVVFEKENLWHSDKLPIENGEIEAGNSDSLYPGRSSKQTVSPVKLLSSSPDISPSIRSSPGKLFSSPVKGVQESFDSAGVSRERHSPLHQRSTRDGTRVGSQEHLSPSAKGASSYPQRPTKISQQKDHSPHNGLSESPRRYHSPPRRRKQTRSTSRSPIRQKVSPRGYGRDCRDRSRSRSPHIQDRHRPER